MSTVTKHRLPVPYLRQTDNAVDPNQTCNVTAMAMCAHYHGVRGNGDGQLEDQFAREMASGGYDRYDMESMTRFLNTKPGVSATFSQSFSVDRLVHSINKGVPVIVSGRFTPSWHFIVIVGYDAVRKTFIVHDPYGEYWQTGYDTATHNGIEEYSYRLIRALCNDDGRSDTIWAIAVDGAGTDANRVK
jgi:uncharacterized protein YvpB